MKKKGNEWSLAQKAVDERPPYLGQDELTPERLYKANPDKLSSVDDARSVLDKLVEAGQLRTEERRNMINGKARGGSLVTVYLPV